MQFSNPFRQLFDKAAAAAGAATIYATVGDRPVFIKGYAWMYVSAEPNIDNTLDWTAEYTTNGGVGYTAIKNNGNANGLLDTGNPLTVFDKRADAAIAGQGALAAENFTPVRVPANAVIRVVLTTAGTSTIPAIQFVLYGSSA